MINHDISSQDIQREEGLSNRRGRGEQVIVRAGITLAAIVLLCIHLFTKTKLDNISVVLLLLASLPWLAPFIEMFVKSIEVLGTKVNFLENKSKEQHALITTLYQAALHNLTSFEYKHLVNLQSGASKGYVYNGFLPLEMVRLCHHEFVEAAFSGSTWKMESKGAEQFDLADYFKITKLGRDHIVLIDKLRKDALDLWNKK